MAVPVTVYLLVASKLLLAVVKCDSINFYNIRPPVDATPYPNSFKCFTCEQASDNYSCNRWAEDKWCPQNTQYCMTVHHFGRQGKTKFVTKRCASFSDCSLSGCRHHGNTHHTECVSCCEGMVCNVELPTNHTNSVFLRFQDFRSAATCSSSSSWTCVFLLTSALTVLLPL
ncbi:ly6/PLAUR domain-containing protein 6B [Hemibagrus wyckioides]|uniref:ly6/PLAUR domain-containing protein 6B n=1 Tax=Hemibagrus wyckioides TaxID=337641 RepID=UPI00266CF721|nr:ly6/PLAUR domain-containing protein 6B [Hemibagrus wyckioides]XP_058249007.1 ly6/PLAUR domain-containing protein 6B [Hemibagrus wyckioides]XP_058249008.1 ly6/PLAUR domain-containing protein 6B [Hemibagrus wyckioides]